ncbi:DNA replication protein DnaD [Bacillus coahuilensis m2-6]|uniref:DNA replication protein DnaD n=1 Tax=Bacillus coahuilensis p1.1.43 TaxID=1150625 RepID=A0A147K8N3_9BACI|nr:DnaD domain-containing protein [Bacillus coahuilensis]KUP06544.1 DNA replication protein DnaD [Bacillus coahuilensis p1.1.43]KUP08029.1 DNA replication protein DnaD [Bacillus coahuilensis m2-6]
MNENKLLMTWIDEGNLQVPQLLFSKYKKLQLNEVELMVILQILSFQQKGIRFPTPEQLSSNMTISSSECASILRKLFQQNIIQIEEGTSIEGIRFEQYSLQSLWERIVELLRTEKKAEEKDKSVQLESNLYSIFEQEFGRPLSPIEGETLTMWIDQDEQDPMIIKAALREAVISNKLNFRYIDRILFEWKKNGITTVDQARNQSEQFRQQTRKDQPNTTSQPSKKTVPFYNWLEQ